MQKKLGAWVFQVSSSSFGCVGFGGNGKQYIPKLEQKPAF